MHKNSLGEHSEPVYHLIPGLIIILFKSDLFQALQVATSGRNCQLDNAEKSPCFVIVSGRTALHCKDISVTFPMSCNMITRALKQGQMITRRYM